MMTIMRRGMLIAALSLALWTGGTLTASAVEAAQPPAMPKAAQEEFVPVDDLPPQERLPAAQFLIAGYSIVWIGVAFYVWSLWRRLGRVEQDLARVAGSPGRKP
jgi:CcmD family protein